MERLTEEQKKEFRRMVEVPYVLSDEQVEYIVAQFQYAPTELGAPLSDDDYNAISAVVDSLDKWSVGGYKDAVECAPIHAAALCLYGVLARRTVRKEEQEICSTCRAMKQEHSPEQWTYCHLPLSERQRISGVQQTSKWSDQDHSWEYEQQGLIGEKLSAGSDGPLPRKEEPAKLDAVLGIVRAKLVQQNNWNPTYADIFCEEVRFRVEAKPKTLEERVKVSDGGTPGIPIWIVKRDGETVLHMSKDLYTYEDAKIYRLGLIAQLKQEEKEVEK